MPLLEHSPAIHSQAAPEGIWEGYDGEWRHVSQQLTALAEATPAEKFAWRPACGGGPLDRRSPHAHRVCEFLSAEHYRSQDARGSETGRCCKFLSIQRCTIRCNAGGMFGSTCEISGDGKWKETRPAQVYWWRAAGCHPLAPFSTAPEICTPLPAVEAPLPKAPCSRSSHSTALSFLVPRSPGRNNKQMLTP